MGFTGYTSSLPSDVLPDAGVLYIGASPLGVSVGGIKFDEGREERQVQFDGMRSPVQGLEAISKWTATLSATIIQVTEANLVRLMPGTTVTTTGTAGTDQVKSILAVDAGTTFNTDSGSYQTNLRAIWKRRNGGFVAVLFPLARCRKWDLAGEDNGEAKVNTEWLAVLPATTAQDQLGDCPFKIELRDALPVA